MPDFSGSVQRLPKEKWGEHPSVLDFIPQSQHGSLRDGSSTTDVTGWIQDGLDSLATAGGGILYLPWGVYPVVDIDIPSNVTLVGDGPAKTILKRRANLPTGRGVLNIAGVNSGFESLAIDGQVTTPQTALYSSLSDPSSTALTANSSVRIHPGAKEVLLRRFRIFHSGGYAVHIDARTGNVYRIEIDEAHLHDNRSWLFGAVSGSEIYGSWTGGILAQGDGLSNNYAVRGLKVTGGKFRRGTGNQVWSHVYGFGTLHSDFRIQGNSFEDIGRDGIMIGAVVGGDVSGNNFRRIGYVATDDTSPAVPRWINGQWAVGLDTAGLTRGVNYRGNTFINCYGAAMDLDGFAEGVVDGNTVIVSLLGEPEYSEDAVGSWAGNYCYGAQVSNTNDLAAAGVGVKVTGNRFRNCGLGAIRMYASRRGTVSGNTIEHPAGAAVAPIILGNVGAGDNKRAYGNTVTDNDIYYSPGSPVGVVQEDANGFNFTSGDVNRVYGNRMHGTNTFEFFKHSTSGSRTAQEFASAKAALTAESKNVVQREDGYWRGYWVEAGVSKAVFSLLDRVTLSGGGFGGPLWNISVDAVGGLITTGARTSCAFDDAVVSGKVYADGFLAVAATTFAGAEANLLPDTVGLIRYNAVSKIFEQSTSVSAGARVWTALAGSSLSGLTAGRIPYTTGASAIADSPNLAWNNGSRVLTVTGATGTASIVAATSFIQAAEGFYTPSNSSAAIGAPFGGVTALSLISSRNDGAAGLTLDRTSATIRRYGMGIDSAGAFFLRDETAGSVRMVVSTAGLVTFGATLSIDQAGNMTATGVVQAGGVNAIATSPAYNTLQTNGGMYAVLGATVDQGLYLKTFAGTPNSPASGYGALSHRSGSTYLYWNGSAWATVDLSASLSGAVLTTTNQEVEGFKYFGQAGSDRLVMYRVADNQLGIQTMLDGQTDPTSYSYGGPNNHLILQPRVGIVGIGSVNGSYNLYVDGTLGVSGTSTFAGVVGTVFNSTASGAAIGFQTSNSNFQVNGNGVVSSAGGINVGGVNVISSARAILGTQLQVDSATLDSQVYVSSAAPRIGLGNHATYASRTQGARFVMATAGGHFGLPASGDAFIFTEGVGSGSAGNLYLGAAVNQTLKLDTSNDATFARRVILAGLSGAAGLTVSNGWVDAAAGFFTAVSSYEALKATSGGCSVRSLHASTYSQVGQSSGAPTATSGSALAAGAVYWDTGLSALRLYNGSSWVSLASGGVSAIAGTANQVNVSASTGAVTLSLPQDVHSGATPTFAGVVAAVFNSTATGGNIAFQTSNANFQVNGAGVVSSAGGYNTGGVNVIDADQNVYAAALQTTGAAAFGSTDLASAQVFIRAASVNGLRVHNSATPSPTGGAGIQAAIESAPASGDRLAFYSFGVRSGGSNFNGGNFTAFATQAWTLGSAQGTELRFETTPNGSALRAVRMTIGQSGLVTIGSTVSIDQVGNLTASATVQAGGVNVVAGSPAFNSLQSNGGVYAVLGATLDQGLYLKTFAGTPNNPGAGYGGLSHRSGSTYLYWNGSAWATVDLAATGGGVSSLAGTANQVNVSASTGAVTLSLPQNIHTGASPTFSGVTAGAFSSSASGSSIAFQTSNFNFQADGNGNISGAGSANMTQGYRIGGTTVIDSSRAATNLASATAAGVFQSQATGTNIAFQTTNFNFQVNGNGVVSSAGGYNLNGVNVINTSRQFVGYGVDVGSYGINAGGYNVNGGYSGQTWNVVGTFTINGTPYTTLVFRGGILVSAS